MNNRILSELQMLTGVVTDDVTYLLYLLLEGGTYFERDDCESRSGYSTSNTQQFKTQVASFDEWFASLSEGGDNNENRGF